MSLVKCTIPYISQEIIASDASSSSSSPSPSPSPIIAKCIQGVMSDISELSYQNGALLQQNSYLTDKVEALESKTASLQLMISKLEECHLQQIKKSSSLQEDNDYLRQKYQQELTTSQTTTTLLETIKQANVALETEIQYLKKKYNTDSTKAINKIDILEKEKGRLIQQNEEVQFRLKEKIRLYEVEKSSIKSELEKSATIAGKLSSQNYSLEQANYSLKQDNSHLQRKLDDSGCVVS